MNIKKVLTHLIRAGRDALHLEESLKEFGYGDTPYYNLYGEISEAVYAMLGEETDTIDESITAKAMNDYCTSDEICAENLAEICEKNLSDGRLTVPESARRVIEEAAKKRGIEYASLVSLILCEWATRQKLMNIYEPA